MPVSLRALVVACILSWPVYVQSQSIKLMKPSEVISSANVLYDSGKYAEAIALLKTIDKRDTAYAQMLSDLAFTYIEANEPDNAIAICREALATPSAKRALYLRIEAIATNKKGDYNKAVTLFENVLKEYPTDVSAIYSLALAQLSNKDYDKARSNFFKALNINPFHRGCHLNLARIAIGQGRKVHAMMAMGMYLGLNDEDNPSLVLINNFLDNQVSTENSISATGSNGPAKVDQMIRARIVNEETFKSVFPVKAPVVQQYELLFDQLNTIPQGKDDPYVNYYLPVYKSIAEANGLEPFVYHLLSSSNVEAAAKWRNKNEKEMKAFYNATNTALRKNREKLASPELGFPEAVSAWHNNNNQLAALGNAVGDKRTGRWIFFHTNSQKSAEGSYSDAGAKAGVWRYYHENGKVKSIEDYQSGEVTLYSADGAKSEHFFLKDDEISGVAEIFYSGGPVREKANYVAGKREGIREIYFPDGTVNAAYRYKEGKADGDYTINFENGKLRERCAYKNETLQGKYESFHPNGKRSDTGTYSNGYQTGEWKYYYSNGKLKRSGKYNEKGAPVGEWVYYDQAGQLTEKRNFDSEGRYHGDVTYYDDGKLFCTSSYKKDVFIKDTYLKPDGTVLASFGSGNGTFSAKSFFSTGQLRSEGNYKNGKAEGKWKFYNRFGQLVSDYNYKDNQLDGSAKEYYPSGELKSECEYKDGELHGFYRDYYRNGKTKQEGWYQDGDREQRWLAYYQDGTIESDYYFIEGKDVGRGYEFATDGKKCMELEFGERPGAIEAIRYFDSKGNESSKKRIDGSMQVYEESFANGKIKSRSALLAGSYAGKWERYYPDGNVHFQYEMKNGKRNGKYELYDVGGSVSNTGTYINGIQAGTWNGYHRNGKPYTVGSFLDNERDSLWVYYFENGKVSSRGFYQEDMRHGITTYFAIDGAPVVEKKFIRGDIVAYRTLTGGSDSQWVPFTGNGRIEASYPNGTRAFVEEYKNGLLHGVDQLYYPDGKLYSEYRYDYGDFAGEYRENHPNGKLKEKGLFKDDERAGLVEWFAEDGTLEESASYRMGYRDGKTVLYNKGAKKEFIFWNRVAE